MLIQQFEVLPELQPYVKLICTMDCDDGADTNHIRVLPDACVELFVNYTSTPLAIIGNELYDRSIVTSRMSRYSDVQMRKGAGCIAICFYPGEAYRFFNLPMHQLADKTLVLSDLWNGMAGEIESKLADSCSHKERSAILQKYLLQQLIRNERDQQVAECLRKIQRSAGHILVSQLSTDTSLSQRHLSRKFQQIVGLSPKEYLRVFRFIRSLDHLKKYPLLSLTEVAYQSAYYDQAHFIRDFKSFTGHTPGQFALSTHILY
ncbi:MAG: helix-turn-helix domain-containing protein [Daejeonella sp.]|uniref:AraC family transcriptional regulator n=1 Tax=Daejeonella sp. TaxID=2805397 RepID=UPI002732889E|nr:helix-turn-helix domain-containing protein [Daejeonella sp.]MDP3469939.1 helix-turn-helix domain-containing protein [Daejeonella sp.]